MGVDIYTPAMERLEQDATYRALQVEYESWGNRKTVESQQWTGHDMADFERIRGAIGKLEYQAGSGRCRLNIDRSAVPAVQAYLNGDDCEFTLTPAEVPVLVNELRDRIRREWTNVYKWAGIPKDQIPDTQGFGASVRRYNLWRRVRDLGEGCYVA